MVKKKFVGPTNAFTFRYDIASWQKFTAIAMLHGDTPTSIFETAIEKYMAEHINSAAKKLSESI